MPMEKDLPAAVKRQAWQWMESPIGPLLLRSHGDKVTGVFLNQQQYFPNDAPQTNLLSRQSAVPDVLCQLETQLTEYFAGCRTEFQIEMNLLGTPFQRSVWLELLKVPFGKTASYAQIATQIGKPRATRAVGAAIGRNPLSIVLPCHRIIGKSGGLTGYAGGLDKKRWLLSWEQAGGSKPAIQQALAFCDSP
ncbi:methylated-DNA--[protein]-cysteine S-methyltransferase [Pirellulaceae bacterium SH449]